jgi:hypothetical protein
MALVHGAAESITEELEQKVVRERLTLVARNGDAIIKGVVVSYRNTASDYTGTRDNLTILSSSVEIVADIVLLDVKNGKEIYKGRIVSSGQYNFEIESEADGRQRAVEDITEKILMNSIRSW